jgi:hypothetical protein
MRILSLLIFYVILFSSNRLVDSPHGSDFKISCSTCHSSNGWQFDRSVYSFDHNKTKLPLIGQHTTISCKQCHPTLVFSEAKNQCVDCHSDVHEATTGSDCSRCHTPASWLVNDITEIHRMSRFPLSGAHRTADCYECHKSESSVRFDIAGVECIDCHRPAFLATSSPNHTQAGFSQDCSGCHPVNATQWNGNGFNHNFFPLSQAHAIQCSDCHVTESYSGLNPECNSCHQDKFLAAKTPDHIVSGFPENCKLCHSLSPGWKPVSYRQHDSQSFPIYSGEHEGEWNSCTDCHSNTNNYAVFSCIDCHEHNQSSMDGKHRGEVSGYSYNSAECLRCHKTGKAD